MITSQWKYFQSKIFSGKLKMRTILYRIKQAWCSHPQSSLLWRRVKAGIFYNTYVCDRCFKVHHKITETPIDVQEQANKAFETLSHLILEEHNDIQGRSESGDGKAGRNPGSTQEDLQISQAGPRCVYERDSDYAEGVEEDFRYGRVRTDTKKFI